MKKTSPSILVSFSILFLFSACTSETPVDTKKPVVTLNNLEVFINDGDGIKNDLKGNITATDNETVVAKHVTAGGVDGHVNGDTFIVSNVPAGKQMVIGSAEDDSGNTGKTTKTVTIEAPAVAPTITPTAGGIDENQVGGIAGTIKDYDAGKTYTETMADFDLDGKNIVAVNALDYETAQTADLTVTENGVTGTATVDINDKDEAPKAVDMADLTYTRSLDNVTVTEGCTQ